MVAALLKVEEPVKTEEVGKTGRHFVCDVCGWEYDEAVGSPENGIKAGTKWEDIPEDFQCPLCGAPKAKFLEK